MQRQARHIERRNVTEHHQLQPCIFADAAWDLRKWPAGLPDIAGKCGTALGHWRRHHRSTISETAQDPVGGITQLGLC